MQTLLLVDDEPNIVNEAALRAVRAGRGFVTQADMEESIEVVIAGYQRKNAILTDKEKLVVSYHEIGHALVAAKQTDSAPVQKITIVPRTSGALGYTMQVDEGNHYLMTKEEIENKIATLTGGRAAEEIVFGSITTGAFRPCSRRTMPPARFRPHRSRPPGKRAVFRHFRRLPPRGIRRE